MSDYYQIEETNTERRVKRWILVIVFTWTANFMLRAIVFVTNFLTYNLGVLSRENSFTLDQLSLFNLSNSFSIAITLVVVLLGSYDIFKAISNILLKRLSDIAEKDYSAGVFEILDGSRALWSLEKEMKKSNLILNTHFSDHDETAGSYKFHAAYYQNLLSFRNSLKKIVSESDAKVEEIASENYEEEINQLKRIQRTNTYEGYCLRGVNVHWINFTIVYTDGDPSGQLFLGFGAGALDEMSHHNVKPYSCFYTKNLAIINDFEKRFTALKTVCMKQEKDVKLK